ncbi:S-layer homology domain-containing protein [Paenibacillus sp. 1_12]|uniref:S-layer homology domain-containing protein n=1 Tax=Paenibacillus sp. 1_12 TaxID=1566278 RepID=UPI0008F0CC4C|nr:S-layer homology domain-containing protein [Paenibacillus sp. 1_12]SFK82180.1 S-layer homology domain-containing protein [Paenibacillus sp. 1_12]
MRQPKRLLALLMSLVVLFAIVPITASAEQADNLTWKSIVFGQSTDLSFAPNVLPGKEGTNYATPQQPGTINGTIVLESRGGKIAPGHDGMTFYYTTLNPKIHNFVLQADVTIEQFGPETSSGPNGQESAGLMVRDINGGPRQDPMIVGYEEVPAASNFAAVGAMRVSSAEKSKVRISSLVRTGVQYPWGNLGGNATITAFNTNTAYDVPVGASTIGKPVRLKLERTNDKFIMTTTFTHVTPPVEFKKEVSGSDLVQVIDPDNMYVGFYVARNAKMIVENASLTLSAANTVPTPVTPPAAVNASMNIVSAPQSGSSSYDLKTLANFNGTLTVTKDGAAVVTDAAVKKNEPYVFNTSLDKETTGFSVTYTPTGAPSNAPITKTITVTKKIYNMGAGLYVSPTGTTTATGTINDPMDLATAIRYVLPGETIFMRGGTYTPSATINIGKEYSGVKDKIKTLTAYNGEKVLIDGQGKLSNVLQLNGDYWRINGIQITKATSGGMRVSGDNNIVEQMLFNFNGDTGLQISGSGTDPDFWPKNNLILNSESHDNRDISDENADGFAAKLGVGVGNVFRGNIAHHNIDDGWDLYNRTNEGPNMPITLEGNIAYSNGKLSNGYNKDGNAGNGFKIGGEGLPVPHIVKNNIAFDNNMDGFTDNFNPGKFVIENNTSFNNKRFNFIFRLNPYFKAEDMGIFKNNLSFRTVTESTYKDSNSGTVTVSTYKDFISGKVDATDFFFDGQKTVNSNNRVVTAADFVSLIIPDKFERDANGFIKSDFLKVATNSALRTAGTNGSYVGALVTVPSTPTGLTVSTGYKQIPLTWDSVMGATYYNVYRSTDNINFTNVKTTTTPGYTDSSLMDFVYYYYKVSAANYLGESASSAVVSGRTLVLDNSPSSGSSSTSTGGGTTNTGSQSGSDPQKTTVGSKAADKVIMDAVKLSKAIESLSANEPKISIEVKGTEQVSIVQVPAASFSEAGSKVPNAYLSIKANGVTYDLKVKALDVSALAKSLGVDVKDVTVNIIIEKVSGETATAIEANAKKEALTTLTGAFDFSITVEANGKSLNVTDFGKIYVSRSFDVSGSVDTNKTSGVLYDPTNGTMSFVPTLFTKNGNSTTVTIKRPGNSIYTVITADKTFADLKGHWAKADVELLASKLLVKGSSDTAFAPQNQITRAEFAALLVRAAGLTEEATTKFPDVTANDWFAGAVGAASKAGLIDGFENGTFQPSATVTREQMAVMISRAIEFTGKKGDSDGKKLAAFEDNSNIAVWAKDAVATAVNAGIVNGTTDKTFAPSGQAIRAEAVVMLSRLLKFLEFMN